MIELRANGEEVATVDARKLAPMLAMRRRLGSRLRDLRLSSGLSSEVAAHDVCFSRSKLSRIETGLGIATGSDVADLCLRYKAPDDVKNDLLNMVSSAEEPRWWECSGTVAPTLSEILQAATNVLLSPLTKRPVAELGLTVDEPSAPSLRRRTLPVADDNVLRKVLLQVESLFGTAEPTVAILRKLLRPEPDLSRFCGSLTSANTDLVPIDQEKIGRGTVLIDETEQAPPLQQGDRRLRRTYVSSRLHHSPARQRGRPLGLCLRV